MSDTILVERTVVCKCGDELQPDNGAICGACLQPELAAAEERGRRAGIEERDELRALLGKLVRAMRLWGSDEDGVPEQFYDDWKAAEAALAPRDSGKEG